MCVCEKAIVSSLMVRVAARTKVESMSILITVATPFLISRWKQKTEKRSAGTLMTVGLMHVESTRRTVTRVNATKTMS